MGIRRVCSSICCVSSRGRSKWTLRYVRCTWSECLALVGNGAIDLMPDVAYSVERDAVFDFPDVAVTHSWSQIYRNPRVQVRSIADLAALRVAVLRGGIQQAYVARLMAGSGLRYTPVLVDTYADGFEAVRQGRADAVVTNTFYGSKHARAYGLAETPIMFDPVSLYFVTRQGGGEGLLDRIDKRIEQWRDDPDSVYYLALRQAMAPPPVTIVPHRLKLGLYAAGAAVMLLLGFSLLLRWQVRRAIAELDRANRHLDHVLSASPVVLYQLRREGGGFVPEWASPNIERVFGFTPAQVAEPGWWESHLHPDDREAAVAGFADVAALGQMTREYRIIDAAGRTRHVRDELRLAAGPAGDSSQVVGTWSDLTEAREQAAQVNFLTNYDSLTGLANRATVRQRLAEAIDRARPAAARLAVMCIDLDRFKSINETLGHAAGDALLRVAAQKLAGVAGAQDNVARIGGDRFVLILGGDPSEFDVAEQAQHIVRLFSNPDDAGPDDFIVTASIGISLFPADGGDADTLLKHAELALYEAKQRGRSTYSLFASELSSGALERLVMENALRGAAARGELVLHYQPQVDLGSGALVGVEALVRWNHPEIGLVPPGQFIPLAEETGTIDDIAAWVLMEACRQMVEWRGAGLLVPRVAVNLSGMQIEDDALSSQVAGVLRDTGLEPACLELEITESTIMRKPDKAISVLRSLKAQGVKLSVDDFGTGYSSLAYLKRLPLDRLKIDQSFVRDIGQDIHDEAISRAVIELARGLGLETVAEGVEREEQSAFLRAEGCEFAQGYLFSRPLPAADLRAAWSDAAGALRTCIVTAGGP